MTISKAAPVNAAKASRPARKEPAEPATESTALQLGELSEHLGYALKRAQLKIFEDFLRCVAPLQLTPAQFSVLLLLDENPGRNQTEIANTLGILRPNFVAMLDGLESRDLCARIRSTNDRRSHILVLTDKGRAVLARARKLVAAKHEARLNELLGSGQPRRAAFDAGHDRKGVLNLSFRVRRLAQARNPYSRSWLWIPGSRYRAPRNDGDGLPAIHQDHPDVVDVGERRAGQQQIAGRGEERRGVVVVEIGRRVEAERVHLRKGALVDHRAGGIGGAAGAAVGAVGIGRQRRNAGRVLERPGQRQRIFLVGAAAARCRARSR